MAVLRFNTYVTANWIKGTTFNSAVAGIFGGENGMSSLVGQPSDSYIFGSGAPINNTTDQDRNMGLGQIFIFKGTPPTDFVTAFTSISTRSSDLLLVLSLGFSSSAITDSTTTKRLVAISQPGTKRLTPTGNIVRASNVVTVTMNTSVLNNFGNRLPIPGQSITISNMTSDATFNGTHTVVSTPTSSTFTFNQSGSNSTAAFSPGTMSLSYNAFASGTASWFCIARTAPAWLISTPFTDFAAVIGTVGTVNSGADLEIISTTINSGSTYASAGFYLNFPFEWSVP